MLGELHYLCAGNLGEDEITCWDQPKAVLFWEYELGMFLIWCPSSGLVRFLWWTIAGHMHVISPLLTISR